MSDKSYWGHRDYRLLHLLTGSFLVLELLLKDLSAALSVVSLTAHLLGYLFELFLNHWTLTETWELNSHTVQNLKKNRRKNKIEINLYNSHWGTPTLDSACWCLSTAWLRSWLVLVRSLSRSVSSLRAWTNRVCSSCSFEAWLQMSFCCVDRLLSSSDTRPRNSACKCFTWLQCST